MLEDEMCYRNDKGGSAPGSFGGGKKWNLK